MKIGPKVRTDLFAVLSDFNSDSGDTILSQYCSQQSEALGK